jgi:3-oxoacyl-[acyl-carrier protein] reductase
MIIVSGASRGLGKAIFNDLTSKNENVIGLSKSLPTKKNMIQCDVSSLDSVKNCAAQLKKINNKAYAFINAAGVASMNLALATPEETIRKIIDINLLGTIFTSQMFTPLLIRNGCGRIINFSTIAVKLGIKGESVYTASKAGVEELSGFKITVNCISPGPIKTDLTKGVSEEQIKGITDQQIFNQVMMPEDVVDSINLLLSNKAKHISGQIISVGGA